MSDLKIRHTHAGPDEVPMFHQYPGQMEPQQVYVVLEPNVNPPVLYVDWESEIGQPPAIPMDVYYGKAYRFLVSSGHWMTGDELDELLDTIAPIARRLCDHYDERWDGNNIVGYFNPDIKSVQDDIFQVENLCFIAKANREVWIAEDIIAGEWKRVVRDYGLTHESTDEELFEAGEKLAAEVLSDGAILLEVQTAMDSIREQLKLDAALDDEDVEIV